MAATEHDTEQGFGTGLRAQLEKRREADEPTAEQPEAPDTPELPPAAEAVELPDFAEAELAGLRRDLAEVRAREQEARAELAELQSRLAAGHSGCTGDVAPLRGGRPARREAGRPAG